MSGADWPKVTLGDHVDLLSGFAFKSKHFTDEPNAIPLVKGENVHQGFIDWKIAKRWPTAELNGCEKYFLKVGDVVLAMDRPWIEAGLKWAWIRPEHPKALLVQRVSRMRGLGELDTSFLRYIVGSSEFTDYIKPIVTGVNVPHISGGQIKAFSFKLPPLPRQRKIASILSAYDDLIENNTRRIAILEEMAQAIYREWFVNFRFPGHENVKLVESTLGMIPEGWEPTELGSCSQIVPGYAFKSKDWQESGVPVVKIKNITENNCVDMESADCVSESLISDKMYKFMLKTGDLLIAMTGATAGKAGVLRMRVPSALNQRVAKICPNDGFRSLLWCFIIGNRKLFFNLADGAAQPNMSGGQIESVPLLVPSGHILSLFESSVCDIAKLVDSLYFKNRNLRTTRDLLLPKLISGLLDVEDLDIDTGLTAEELEEATA